MDAIFWLLLGLLMLVAYAAMFWFQQYTRIIEKRIEELELFRDMISGDIKDRNEKEELEDVLYEKAEEIVIESQSASTSFLQRKLDIGYARAAHIMDLLELRGVIEPGDGARRRKVLKERK